MDKTKQNRFDWHLKQIGLFIISFIVVFIWFLLGYIIAIIPSCEWLSFKSVCEEMSSWKLLDVLAWLKDAGELLFGVITTITAVCAISIYKRSAKNQEFTNLLTKRSIIHTLQKDLRDGLYHGLTNQDNQDNIEHMITYQITPPLIGLLNTYNSMIGIYFQSDKSYKELFDKTFLNEIKKFLNYKMYEDLLGDSYKKINLSREYQHLTEYIKLHNIEIGEIYEIL